MGENYQIINIEVYRDNYQITLKNSRREEYITAFINKSMFFKLLECAEATSKYIGYIEERNEI